jgi:hypothetical protein
MRQADYDQAIEAARRWIAEHGRYPRTIKRRWGWEELMREAAANGRLGPEGETRKARRLELLCALRRAHEELGRWPTAASERLRPAGTSRGAAT